MKLKHEHLLIGVGAVTATIATVWYMKKHHMHLLSSKSFAAEEADSARIRHNSGTPGLPYRSRMAIGRTSMEPGVTNVGIGTGGVGGWTAAGHNAGLNPSAWSYLTQRNANYTYNIAPSNRLLRPARLGVNAQHKVQGSMGYTTYPANAIFTYF